MTLGHLQPINVPLVLHEARPTFGQQAEGLSLGSTLLVPTHARGCIRCRGVARCVPPLALNAYDCEPMI